VQEEVVARSRARATGFVQAATVGERRRRDLLELPDQLSPTIMFGPFLPGLWLVGTTKVYSGIGADIVMESISPFTPDARLWVNYYNPLLTTAIIAEG
jgi:hypothetical protein